MLWWVRIPAWQVFSSSYEGLVMSAGKVGFNSPFKGFEIPAGKTFTTVGEPMNVFQTGSLVTWNKKEGP